MTKIASVLKHLYATFFLICIGFYTQAQDIEVTDTYLNNAGFNINANYLTAENQNISSASPPKTTAVNGWTLAQAESWGAASSFEFGWNGNFNGTSMPTTDSNGQTGSGQGALGITIGWSGVIIYEQQTTLPAGVYSIEISTAFMGNNSILKNLTGWVANDGNSLFSDFTSAETLGNWYKSTLTLRLTTETAGKIQAGVSAKDSGTTSNARVFIDAIKIISHTVTKDKLQELIDTANEMIANPQSVPQGATVYNDLQTTVTNTQTVIDNQAATVASILTSEDNLSSAINAVNKAIFKANLTIYNNHTATYTSLNNQNLGFTGKGQITITSATNALNNSNIDLGSPDTWIYFPNTLPSVVASNYLSNITVDTKDAVIDTNIRITNYLKGAMVMAHSNTYTALTVYDETTQKGTAMNLKINKHYKGNDLNTLDNNIESFILKRGYMATFAVNQNGTGGSRVYIADDTDVVIDEMPEGLSNNISMVVVRKWRWTTKKGWRGNTEIASKFNCGSSYDYNNVANGTLDVEYVPMRHNPNWNAYANFIDKFNSTHALGYNEPDNSVDDGFSSVADAIKEWPKMMESGLRLGAPGTTDGGLNWTYEFIDKCDELGYRVDFVAWHYYRAGRTAQQLYNELLAIHNRTGRPIWITEFNNGCNWTYNGNAPTLERNEQVIKDFIEMLEDAPFIERYYVWDGCNETLRMTKSGTNQTELYPAGITYRNQVSTMAYTEDFYNSVATKKIQENEPGFCSIDGTVDNNFSHTGTGYTNTNNAIGSGIDYKINFISDGTETLTIKYASPTDVPAKILINNSVATTVTCLSTGGYDTYAEISVNIPTTAGMSNLRIEATTEEGLGNIDYITITNGYPASCEPNLTYPLILSASAEQTENPAKNILDNDTTDDSRWSAEGFPQTVVIDYGQNIPATGTRISTFQNRAYQYKIELADNLYFRDAYVVDRTANTNTSQPIADDFDEIATRYVKLTVTGASGYTGSWASITEFTLVSNNALSNEKIIDDPTIKIYPNPIKDYLNINLEGNYNQQNATIFSLTGKLILKTRLQKQNNKLNLRNLKSGVYVLKITDKNKATKVLKFIKF